jgi:hypothetical protein
LYRCNHCNVAITGKAAVVRFQDLALWCTDKCWRDEIKEQNEKKVTLRKFLLTGVWIEPPKKRR